MTHESVYAVLCGDHVVLTDKAEIADVQILVDVVELETVIDTASLRDGYVDESSITWLFADIAVEELSIDLNLTLG